MYAHLEELLLRIGFLDPKNPKRIMHTLRRIFGRANLSDRDVAILRGIFRQLEWYATHKEKKGHCGLEIFAEFSSAVWRSGGVSMAASLSLNFSRCRWAESKLPLDCSKCFPSFLNSS